MYRCLILQVPSTLNAVANILQVIVESVDFSPYTPQFQQKLKCKRTYMTLVSMFTVRIK